MTGPTCVNMRRLGDATRSQPSLPRPAPPRLPPALGLAARVAHGQPDAGGGPQLARLRADGLAARPRPRRADARPARSSSSRSGAGSWPTASTAAASCSSPSRRWRSSPRCWPLLTLRGAGQPGRALRAQRGHGRRLRVRQPRPAGAGAAPGAGEGPGERARPQPRHVPRRVHRWPRPGRPAAGRRRRGHARSRHAGGRGGTGGEPSRHRAIYAVNALSFLAVIAALLFMRTNTAPEPGTVTDEHPAGVAQGGTALRVHDPDHGLDDGARLRRDVLRGRAVAAADLRGPGPPRRGRRLRLAGGGARAGRARWGRSTRPSCRLPRRQGRVLLWAVVAYGVVHDRLRAGLALLDRVPRPGGDGPEPTSSPPSSGRPCVSSSRPTRCAGA